MRPTALHVAPHPDDEVLGCGATLLALRSAGWRVVNLVCSLGRPADQERRRAELARALEVMAVEGRVAEPPVAMSQQDDLQLAQARVADLVGASARELGAELLLSPHPDDAHPAHALVGRAVASTRAGRRWWAWGLWRDLPAPTRYVPYGDDALDQLARALACHVGETERNDYQDLLRARARLQAVIGAERVLGFGSGPAAAEPYADLIEERIRDGRSGWELTRHHVVGLGHLVDPDPDGR